MKFKETQITSKKVYACSFMDVIEDEVKVPNGNVAQRVYIKHPGGAAMVATTPDDLLILIKQFRYPLNEVLYEIPAGKMDDENESFKACAMRELEEETSYQTSEVEKLIEIYPCVGYSDEKIMIYRGKNALIAKDPKPGDFDEVTEVVLVDKMGAKAILDGNEIKDSKTIIGIQLWLLEDSE